MALILPGLGLQVIKWAEANLIHALTGKPWKFTQGQRRFLMLWYQVDVKTGRWLYRRGVKRGSKGTGKDHFLAAWMLCELFGPVRIKEIRDGKVIGVAHRMPLVQVGANSEDQAKKVLRVVNAMIPDKLASEHGVEKGLTRTTLANGGMVECLTSSEASSEGDPPTAAGMNESHHMTKASGGHKMFGVVRRNVGKSPRNQQARMIEFTNGHEEGGDSIAERSYVAWQLQQSGKGKFKKDILYDSIEAKPGVDIYDAKERRAGLKAAYSDAPWADLDRLEDEVLDPDVGLSESLRFYFNIVAANEESWVEPRKFKAMAAPEKRLVPGDPIVLFMDCSKSEDATVLIGCRLTDGHVFTVLVWYRPPGERGKNELAPRERFKEAVLNCAADYKLCWFGADPGPATEDSDAANYWIPTLNELHRLLAKKLLLWATPGLRGSSVIFDMRNSSPGGKDRNYKFAEMSRIVASEIDDDRPASTKWTHDGNDDLVRHVDHARRNQTPWGLSLGKVNRDSALLVDAAVAMVGAKLGADLVLNSGKLRKPRAPRKPRKAVVMT